MNKEILQEIASLLNQDAEEVLSDLYTTDDEGNEQLKEGANIAKTIKEWSANEVRRVGEQQRKRGIREASQRWEKQLGDLAGDTSLTGDELVGAIRNKIETAGSDTSESDKLTPDSIRKHPAYKEALKADSRALVQERDEARAELDKVRSEYERKSTQSTIMQRAFEELDKANVKWGDDPETKQRRKQVIERLIEADMDRLKVENGKIIVLDTDGQPAQDKDFKDITFDRYVRDIGSTFGFREYEKDKDSPGVQTRNPRSAKQGSTSKFRVTNQHEYDTLLKKHPDKQREIVEAYQAYLTQGDDE